MVGGTVCSGCAGLRNAHRLVEQTDSLFHPLHHEVTQNTGSALPSLAHAACLGLPFRLPPVPCPQAPLVSTLGPCPPLRLSTLYACEALLWW